MPVDINFDDDLSVDDMQAYVAEDFQHSTMDSYVLGSNQLENTFVDDCIGSSAGYEHNLTVR